jgi:hypothetical protein
MKTPQPLPYIVLLKPNHQKKKYFVEIFYNYSFPLEFFRANFSASLYRYESYSRLSINVEIEE